MNGEKMETEKLDRIAQLRNKIHTNGWFEELHLFERSEWIAMNVSRRAIRKPKGETTVPLITDVIKQIDLYLKVVKP